MFAPKEKVSNQIFNIGTQNLSITQIADMVKTVVEREFSEKNNIEIVTTSSDDLRSYHINSDKIKNILNFVPKFSVQDAIKSLCDAYKDNLYPNSMEDDVYFNVKRIMRLKVV